MDAIFILPHVLYSETRIPVSSLMDLTEVTDGLLGQVHWKGFPPSQDIYEPLALVIEDVPKMIEHFIGRKKLSP